jgi:anti-sigma factor RsiW
VTKHNDRHLTTEELSALLDDQLSEQEQAYCDAHLKSCQQCQLALTDLKQTVSLLHALPEPELPRSFVLPTNVSYIQEHPASGAGTQQANLASVTVSEGQALQQKRQARSLTLRRSARILSLIAAVIGLFILAPGVFAILPRFSNNASTASSTNSPVQSASSSGTSNKPHHLVEGTHASPSATSRKTSAPSVAGVGTPQPHATPIPTPKAASTKHLDAQSGPALPLPNLGTPLGQQEVGFPLVALGIIGLLLTRRKRRNQKAT